MTLLLVALLLARLPQEVAAPVSANVWHGRAEAYEEELRTAPVVKIVDLTIGVTHPQRAYVEPGGLIESFAWKKLPPGRPAGYWESYKSEIAAYELDKLLELERVPVVVERKVKGETGAAILWLKGVRPWETVLPLPKPPSWTGEVVRMKMFDCLIGNIDRNKGNLLVDDAWNLFLIDHSRAFVTDRKLQAPLDHFDPDVWKRMSALDETVLQQKLGKWLDRGQIRAMLERRDRMQKAIDDLIKKLGRAAYVR